MGFRESLHEDYRFRVTVNGEGGIDVSLPHQCGDFKILGFDAIIPEKPQGRDVPVVGEYPAFPTDHEFAVKQMELFVRRAQEALDRLRKEQWDGAE